MGQRHTIATAAVACGLGVAIGISVPGIGAAEAGDEPDPITVDVLALGTTDRPFAIKAKGERDFHFRKAVVQPGAATGWHYHTGEEIAVVAEGTLTRFDDDCTSRELKPGDALVEPVGPDEVHTGVNLSSEPVVLYVADLVPAGGPIVKPADDPGCEIPAAGN